MAGNTEFTVGADGGGSTAPPVANAADDPYGTTSSGGTSNAGTAFKLAPDGSETVRHSCACGTNGNRPQYADVMGPQDQVFDVTQFGGQNSGAAFEIMP
jgi:uncharacterized repeat protein (TIGR03803 family)